MTKYINIDKIPFSLFIQKLLYVVVSLLVLLTIFQNVSVVFDLLPFEVLLVFVFLFLVLVVLCIFAKSKKNIRIALCFVLGLSFALRLIFILAISSPIESDFQVLFSSARSLADGDLSWIENSYFRTWAFQIPFVVYESCIWRLFHCVFAIKFLNVLFMLGINYLIYLISKKIVAPKIALLPSLLYAIYPAPIILSCVLTNQHISLFFILLSVYLILQTKSISGAISSGLALCLGNMMRPEGIIVIVSLAAYILFLLLRFFSSKRLDERTPLFKTKPILCSIIIVSYFFFGMVSSMIFSASGIAPHGIGNNFPEWKLVLGLNTKTNGEYTDEYEYLLLIEDDSLRSEKAKETIASSFEQHDKSIMSFAFDKTTRMWGGNESVYWSLSHLNLSHSILPGFTVDDIRNNIILFDKAVYICIHALVLFGTILLFLKRKQRETGINFLYLMWAANYCAYLFIEIQTRYRYFIMPLIFILSTIFLEHILTDRELGNQETYKVH